MVAELGEAIEALNKAGGDLDRALRETPNAEHIHPYLELALQVLELQDEPSPGNESVRKALIARAAEWRRDNASGPGALAPE